MLHFLLQAQVTANGSNSAAAGGIAVAAILISVCVGLVIGIAIAALFCYFISRALEAVPEQYRQRITPGQVWLLLIPFFSVFWNFVVFDRVPASFRAYFESIGRPLPQDDYGKQMGLIYAILAAVGLATFFIHIPFLGLVNLAALVLLIIVTVKFNKYRTLILTGGGGVGGFPVQPTPPVTDPTSGVPPTGTL